MYYPRQGLEQPVALPLRENRELPLVTMNQFHSGFNCVTSDYEEQRGNLADDPVLGGVLERLYIKEGARIECWFSPIASQFSKHLTSLVNLDSLPDAIEHSERR
jgi:hypothetical protein